MYNVLCETCFKYFDIEEHSHDVWEPCTSIYYVVDANGVLLEKNRKKGKRITRIEAVCPHCGNTETVRDGFFSDSELKIV